MRPFLIGIAGLSGSGKTALAKQLGRSLGDDCNTITLDSYYYAQAHVPAAERAHLNFDHPDALDWPLLIRHLDALSRGEAIEEPHYLFDQHTRAADTRRIEPRPFLILEGILSLHRREIRELLDFSVYVSTRPEECLRRRIERDVVERGRTPESVLEQYRATVWPMAVEFVLPTRELAHLVVSGEEPFDASVAAILEQIEHRRLRAATA